MLSSQNATVVVSAVIVCNGEVLIQQRKVSGSLGGIGRWECPGGKVNSGESFDNALRREIREELGLEVKVGRLLYSQINTYSSGVDYLVLYYACTLADHVVYYPIADVQFVPIGTFLHREKTLGHFEYPVLPGTVEAISYLGELTALREEFSFTQHDTTNQSPDETLHVMTYELGSLVEHHHKTKRYGEQGHLGSAKKQMSDLISMCRYYCEQRGWDFNELMSLGEEAYLERMEDLRKYGVKEVKK